MYGRDQYQTAATDTAGPAQLVLMLYDGALVRVDVAVEAIAERRFEAAHVALVKAQAIVDELNMTLDIDRGGEVAVNLREVYRYCSGRLIEANLGKDVAILDEVGTLLRSLRDAWHESCILGPVAVV